MNRQRRTIDALRNTFQDASSHVAKNAGRRARQLSAAASDRFPDAYRWTKAAARDGSDRALDLAEDGYRIAGRQFNIANNLTSNRLRGNVLPALLLAGAAGYILSYLFHRNRVSRASLPKFEQARAVAPANGNAASPKAPDSQEPGAPTHQ
jgi:hypothetical protein